MFKKKTIPVIKKFTKRNNLGGKKKSSLFVPLFTAHRHNA